jgi:predicted nucleotidyltransferase
MFMLQLVEDKLSDIVLLCKEHKVRSVALFGSAAKNSMHEDSDIDLLVQFSDEIDVLDYADNYFSLLEKLELLLGKKIDLVSKKSLKNPILIEEIDRSKIDLYAD